MIVFINHLLSTVGQMLFSRLTRWFSGGRGLKQKCHPLGGGVDIFWNYTLEKKFVQIHRIYSLPIHLLINWDLAVNESIHKDSKLN